MRLYRKKLKLSDRLTLSGVLHQNIINLQSIQMSYNLTWHDIFNHHDKPWDWTELSHNKSISLNSIEDMIKEKFMLEHRFNNPSLTDDEIENLWRIDCERREEKRRLDMIELENRERIKHERWVRIQEYKRNLREQRKETHRLRNERRNYKIALRCFTRTLRRTMLFRDELLETSLHPDRIDHWLSLGFGLSDM